MIKSLKILVALLLLGSLTLDAQPFKTWSWVGPSVYENGDPIIADPLTFRLHCGIDQGGPYPTTVLLDLQTSPALQDMVALVMGLPGTYYCVETATSSLFGSTSEYSNEANFTVTPASLGFVPVPPILTLI